MNDPQRSPFVPAAHRVAVAAHLLCVLTAVLPAQGNWSPATAGPPARAAQFMVFDELRDRVVMFGGLAGTNLNDTWEHDGSSWRAVSASSRPSARNNGAAAFDTRRGRTVIFGGYSNTWYSDTWAFDGAAWTQLQSSNWPSGRAGAAMAYDSARDRIVLFGGAVGSTRKNDTWEFDGTNWNQRWVSGPTGRSAHAMAYDEARGVVVLFGGDASSNRLNDTWTWDGTSWVLLNPTTRPTARYRHAMCYDRSRGLTLMFGGVTNSPGNDLWQFDGSGWTQLNPVVRPRTRFFPGMAYDGSRDTVVLFGGHTGSSSLSDCWEYGPPQRASYRKYGSGCPGSAGTATLRRASGLPFVGQRFEVELHGAPGSSGVAMMVFGFGAAPLDLGPLGMPGCWMRTTLDVVETVPTTNGAALWSVIVPNQPALVGGEFYQQAVVVDPAAGNALGVVVSDAARGVVGVR